MPPPPPAPPVFYSFKDNQTLVGEYAFASWMPRLEMQRLARKTRRVKTPQPRQAPYQCLPADNRFACQLRHQGAARRRRQARQVHSCALGWFARCQPPRTCGPGERAVGQVVSAFHFPTLAGHYGPCGACLVFQKSLPQPSASPFRSAGTSSGACLCIRTPSRRLACTSGSVKGPSSQRISRPSLRSCAQPRSG